MVCKIKRKAKVVCIFSQTRDKLIGKDIANGMTCNMELVRTLSCGPYNQGKTKSIYRVSSVIISFCKIIYFLWLFYLVSKSALIDMTPSFADTPRQQKIQYFQLKIFNNPWPYWKHHSNTVRPPVNPSFEHFYSLAF